MVQTSVDICNNSSADREEESLSSCRPGWVRQSLLFQIKGRGSGVFFKVAIH